MALDPNRDRWYSDPNYPPRDPCACNSGNPIGDFFCRLGCTLSVNGVGDALGNTGRGIGDALGNTGRGIGDALGNTGRGVGDALGNAGPGVGDGLAAWGESVEAMRQLLAIGLIAVVIVAIKD